MKDYFVYILAHKPHGAIYIGVTNDLIRRVYEHKEGLVAGYTKTYRIKALVYYEAVSDIESAIPEWKDLYAEMCGVADPASPLRFVRNDIEARI